MVVPLRMVWNLPGCTFWNPLRVYGTRRSRRFVHYPVWFIYATWSVKLPLNIAYVRPMPILGLLNTSWILAEFPRNNIFFIIGWIKISCDVSDPVATHICINYAFYFLLPLGQQSSTVTLRFLFSDIKFAMLRLLIIPVLLFASVDAFVQEITSGSGRNCGSCGGLFGGITGSCRCLINHNCMCFNVLLINR